MLASWPDAPTFLRLLPPTPTSYPNSSPPRLTTAPFTIGGAARQRLRRARAGALGEQTHPKVVAVGECGLDYHYENNEDMRKLQHEVFVAQMELAAELQKPLIVHTREAEEDTLALMRAHLPRYSNLPTTKYFALSQSGSQLAPALDVLEGSTTSRVASVVVNVRGLPVLLFKFDVVGER